MKDMLIPVGCNEMLDFVRRDHSSSPDLPPSILSFNAPDAAGRCNSPEHQHSMLRKAQSIQQESALKKNSHAHDL
jgi:hypothetical protein